MFAKPAKKPGTQPPKQRTLNKPKAVAVKTGVKPMQTKKTKLDSRLGKANNKLPARPDPGYSLYSTDSEDQVAASFKEMETCEKMLTHLKYKQKASNHSKAKVKKSKERSPGPKALNDIQPGSEALTIPGYGFPYGMSQFLHHIQDPNNPSNPLFNYRLVSSTPDPDKHLSNPDSSSSRPLSHPDHSTQDVPERDISAVSSVPPSQQHVQNMVNMLEIYKQLEVKKYTQLQEASAIAELDKLKSQCHTDKPEQLSTPPASQPGAFIGTGSLGFPVNHQGVPHSLAQTCFQPVSMDSPSYGFTSGTLNFQSPNMEVGRDSSLTAFQPYLVRDSGGFAPPPSWLVTGQQHMQNSHSDVEATEGDQETPQHLQERSSVDVTPIQDIPTSGRTEKSDSTNASGGTDYAMLPHPEREGSGKGQGQTQQNDGNIVYEKQNGLFQIHQRTESVPDSDKSRKTDLSEKGSIHEAPERDVPKFGEGTYNVEGTGTNSQTSQNVSDITTPRNQNLSSSGSTSSHGGKIVFIPNDSNTQNVIGYIPGIPYIQGASQPMVMHVPNDTSGNHVPNLSLPSSGGNQAQSASQLTAQSGPQDVTGSGYHGAAHAKFIAAGDIGVRKLRYLLKELRECSKVSKDIEIGRLATELDEAVNAIPQLALTFNLQTEIDLAIQPLRTESSQLRRKLRLVNQQLKDKDIAAEESPKDINFELLHLQTNNEAIQKQLRDEKEIKTRLAAEVQYLYGEIHKLKVERSKWIAEISEKETAQLKLRQETLLETQNLRHDVDLMRKDHEMTVCKLEGLEKENHILQITLQQRDAEIARQHEVIETMKESIAGLLLELDQSRSGDTTWDQNKSFGLHKLMRIVEEEGASRCTRDEQMHQPTRKMARTPERQAFDINTTAASSSSSATPRLTRAALAYHNRKHVPPSGARMGPDGRQGPASESELDTLVEMQRKEKQVLPSRDKGSRPHRRTSSSSPVRLKGDSNIRHQRTVSSPATRPLGRDGKSYDRTELRQRRERTYERERELDFDESSSPPRRRVLRNPDISPAARDRRAQQQREDYRPVRGAPRYELTDKNGESSEVSLAQSRYSVTDYFKKYPHSSETLTSEPRPPHTKPAPAEARPPHNRPVPAEAPSYQFRTSSQIGERSVNFSEAPVSRNIKQLTLFKGMNGDQTISVIPDDNVSSVSMNSVTTANTIDDSRFRSGIATLDANIAKLQMALQKTKSMLT